MTMYYGVIANITEEDEIFQYEFTVNPIGYMEMYTNGMLMDTISDFGNIKTQKRLEEVVNHLMVCWEVEVYETLN